MEDKNEKIDLRITKNTLNIHKLRNERKYYDLIIKSDVEYFARLHSIDFANFHAKLLSPYMNKSTIIVDLGCGQLPYIYSFAHFNIAAYYGLDLHRESLEIARENSPKNFPLILVQHGVRNVPFPDNSIDIVVSSEILEHLEEPKIYLAEVNRILKKGGYLSLSTPCVSMYFYPYNFLSIILSQKKLFLWYKKVNAHKYWKEALYWHPAIRPRILRKWVKERGFSIKRHKTKLRYYHTPIRLSWRLFLILEKLGFSYAGNMFHKYLKFTDMLLDFNLPIIKWSGIRQFILSQKQ